MVKKRRGPVGVIAIAALMLLVAMAGSAAADALITGRQIKDGTVTGKDLRDGTVAGVDVKDGSLSPRDFSGSLEGPPGPAGPTGAPGPQGPAGPQGALGYEHVVASIVVPANAVRHQDAYCPAGKTAAGGGISSSVAHTARVVETAPLNGAVGWTAGLHNGHSSPVTAYVWAVCVYAS